ncbi:MAG: glycosyltransferase family 4 protein [Armatimonadota bacterium]|nr:glycosyltransferase family 4 protein [Armatimonadota bacterium]MDR7443533.1 glycosyltransferase family 4 protein [Armatimonadota bacterium]MDR7570366.1 glycosyltransferase family 4 protein [Armatimonadota bacterium]MDR7615032.1 glycosyltransferase family 4 protein [Armatimonadota bacterium]
MRVLLVTYDHPFRGRSGVAAYCRDLLAELRGRGIEVVHLYGAERSWVPGSRLRRRIEQGIRLVSLVNSPAPPALSVDRPLQDRGCSALDRLLTTFFEEVRPDVVHVHSLMGFTGSLLRSAKRTGLPVVVTLHDFWALCTRISLVRTDGTPCGGPDEGVNCARFCARTESRRRRLYRRLLAVLPSGPLRTAVERAANLYLRASAHGPREGSGRPTRLPLLQDVRTHGERTRRLVEDLLGADRLLAVSGFVRDVYGRHGVPEGRMQVLPLGLGVVGRVRWRVRHASSPVRFGYLGRLSPFKGAHLLAQVAREIPADRARFLFFGPASARTCEELRRLAGGRPLEFYGPYRREDLPRILEGIDVAVVPTLFQETVGLTALEPQAAGVPVIASALGALPEWVEHGHNGLLFPSGDAAALRRLILLVAESPDLVARFSANTRPPLSIREHVEELLRIYEECRSVCRV